MAFFLHILEIMPNFAPEIRNKVITIKTSKLWQTSNFKSAIRW